MTGFTSLRVSGGSDTLVTFLEGEHRIHTIHTAIPWRGKRKGYGSIEYVISSAVVPITGDHS